MSALPNVSTTIEGRVEYAAADAPKVTFRTGAGELLAVAEHRTEAGVRGRLANLLGSARVRCRISCSDGSTVWIESKDAAWTRVHRGDGVSVGAILHAETATAVASTGGTLFHFVPDPAPSPVPESSRLLLLDQSGGEVGCLELAHATDAAPDANRLAISGIRVSVPHRVDRVERDILLAACVDMTLGSRSYFAGPR
ncbi:hypothetical protein [Nocardia mexicana]|uniref:Uncharacterized protein n=1 Tax=Nocardia mexicana TaxID=279262 RepID=A0A370GZA2_9NOCA|nr:hypothetical protein [Nocardia mexicana]RDI48975.1 hypothetical protein DFR68_107100 [Nocardia mexicana]